MEETRRRTALRGFGRSTSMMMWMDPWSFPGVTAGTSGDCLQRFCRAGLCTVLVAVQGREWAGPPLFPGFRLDLRTLRRAMKTLSTACSRNYRGGYTSFVVLTYKGRSRYVKVGGAVCNFGRAHGVFGSRKWPTGHAWSPSFYAVLLTPDFEDTAQN